MKKGKFNLVVLIICFFIVFIIGYLGSIFTDTGSWYESIKPKIAPPNYWFGIVWTILYIMIAFSIYFSWIGSEKKEKKSIIIFYGINLILNFLWSFIYFGYKNPVGGMIVIVLIWLSTMLLIIWNWKKFKISAYLLIPYILWVSFAAVLNWLTI
jgi:benzodiazapine receptor